MNSKTKNLSLTAMFIAIGVVLPQAFHAIPNAGSIFLPMHIPVLLSGYAVGPLYGALVGFLTPLLSHLIFSMPPSAILPSMLCELTVYGLATGFFSRFIRTETKAVKTYAVLILGMLCGRVTYGVLNALIFRAGAYSMQSWITAAFVTALPGIVIQLILIPFIVLALDKADLLKL